MQSSGGMATVESARAAARQPAHVRPGRRPDRRHLGRPDGGLRQRRHARHRRHLRRHRRRRRRRSCACATCSTRRSATTRRWCRWSTSTRSAPAAARSPTSTQGGVFRVGPQSAGADPGPGLLRPRRHGADVDRRAARCSGRLRPDRGLLGGDMAPRRRARRQAAMQRIADELGMSVEEAALGALQIQKFGMTQAIELNSVRRGYDPREFTLVAAGGAGPLFACDIALELEIPRVLVPPHPGIIAAHRPARHRPPARVRRHRAPLRSKTLDRERLQAPLRRAGARRPSRSSTPTGPGRPARSCGASPTAATPARATRSASTCPPATGRRRLGRGAEGRLPRRARAEYGHRFDAQIEIINIRVVGIGRDRRAAAGRARGRRRRPVAARRRVEREVVFEVDGKPSAVRRRSTTASGCAPATASPARRSSSSTTRRR